MLELELARHELWTIIRTGGSMSGNALAREGQAGKAGRVEARGATHAHDHGHAHSHAPAFAGNLPRAPGFSLMRTSLGERLLLAAALSALLWVAIAGVLWS